MPYMQKEHIDSLFESLFSTYDIDYSSKREFFETVYDTKIKNDFKDITIEFNDTNYPDIRLIEDSHYHQLPDDDKPTLNTGFYGYWLFCKNGKEYDPSLDTTYHSDLVISELLDFTDIDYSPKRKEIEKAYVNKLSQGDCDVVIFFDDENFPDLRFMQEDHYDQHMDEDDKDGYHIYVNSYYILIYFQNEES